MSEEKTPGQVSWTARNMALAGPGENPADVLAELDGAWDYLDPEGREAEEAGAQAVLDSRTPWGDVDVVSIEQHRWHAVIRSGGPDGRVVKVISYGDTGLGYYDSVEEWQAANGPELAAATAERGRLAELLRRYERITTAWTRGMYMARIDCMRGDVKAAVNCLTEGIDGYDGAEWNGTETGAEWWERTKAEEGL